jgi:hypothetical protein
MLETSLLARSVRVTSQIAQLPLSAKIQSLRGLLRLRNEDSGIDAALDANLQWLGRAQDLSQSGDGGVAHSYSLLAGWRSSYPETTGYIIPTLIEYAGLRSDPSWLERARRMLDWLVAIQMPDGAFQGGRVDSVPRVPVTFNTGQILLGLASGTARLGAQYREAMLRAATWLVETQDPDGAWRRHSSPFARPGDRTYDTHVAWALLEAARIEPERGYGEAGLANVRWALMHQRPNGWFDHCCLSDPRHPLAHTLGYVLRGIIEAYRFSNDSLFLDAALRTADGLLSATRPSGYLPGRLDAAWRAAAPWCCLTGSAQIAICWMKLYQDTGEQKYLAAARKVNAYVRSTMLVNGDPNVSGGVAGSFPVYGDYGPFEYLNWAAKFCADSNILESRLAGTQARPPTA